MRGATRNAICGCDTQASINNIEASAAADTLKYSKKQHSDEGEGCGKSIS